MTPVIIYDFSHGFKQTIVFSIWIVYKLVSFLIPFKKASVSDSWPTMFVYTVNFLRELVFSANAFVAVLISSVAVISFFTKIKKNFSKIGIVGLAFFFTFFGFVLSKTASDAYLPMIYVPILFIISFELTSLNKMKYRYVSYFLIILIVLVNLNNIYTKFYSEIGLPYHKRVEAVNKIISIAKGRKYNLIAKGPGSQFRSFTMDYEYLLWLKGKPVSYSNQDLKIYVSENPYNIIIRNND